MPELNAHSLRRLPPALPQGCRHGVSMSRTCQIGLSEHAGFEYRSIEALLDFCTTLEAARYEGRIDGAAARAAGAELKRP